MTEQPARDSRPPTVLKTLWSGLAVLLIVGYLVGPDTILGKLLMALGVIGLLSVPFAYVRSRVRGD